MDDHLFYGRAYLSQALDAQGGKMREAIDGEPEESLKQVDVDAWAASWAHHFAVACPVLRADEMWMDAAKDIKIDVSGDPFRHFSPGSRQELPGERIVVHVPFEGEADVFKLQPNRSDLSPPRARISKGELLLTVDYLRDQTPDIGAQARGFIEKVNKYLGFAGDEIDDFNARLEGQAQQIIEARLERVEKRNTELAKSGIPIGRPGKGGKKTYIADVLVRRPAPSLPRTRADDKAPTLEPVLEERIFEHTLGVIRKQCLHIEQNPRTYVPMGEEDRRNVILSALTTHYDGFTAETDNQGGHTDILARQEGRNVFICECKFWDGEQSFTETIDQLFGYTGWRDTKLAIVMFVRAKGMTGILKKAKTTLGKHAQFVGWKDAASETELRTTMHWPGDEERLADLNVFLVHTPQSKS